MEKSIELELPSVSVLIVDDHCLIRDGLRLMLQSFKREILLAVTEAASAETALQLNERQSFDLVIADYMLAGIKGDEFIRRLKRYRPEIKVLALSNYAEYKIVEAMTEAGALGYILKSVWPAQMLQAIQTVLAGKPYYCNEVALVLLNQAREMGRNDKAAKYKLTAREVEILLLIAEGLTNAEIAKKIFLARRTVDTHRQNLMKKLKINNTAALVRYALELRF